MFLVVEQSIKYIKPIGPFQKYSVRTSVAVSDNKWMHYEHTFVESTPSSHSSSSTGDAKSLKPKVYAVINCKAVLKERNGKTVPVSTFLERSQLYRDLMTKDQYLLTKDQ